MLAAVFMLACADENNGIAVALPGSEGEPATGPRPSESDAPAPDLAAASQERAPTHQIDVDLKNHPPEATVDGPEQVAVEHLIRLDASGSVDPDHDALTYHWAQTDRTSPVPRHSRTVATASGQPPQRAVARAWSMGAAALPGASRG